MCIILMNYFLTNRQLSRLENKMCSDIAMILDILIVFSVVTIIDDDFAFKLHK
jgi:hypothetical protein